METENYFSGGGVGGFAFNFLASLINGNSRFSLYGSNGIPRSFNFLASLINGNVYL